MLLVKVSRSQLLLLQAVKFEVVLDTLQVIGETSLLSNHLH